MDASLNKRINVHARSTNNNTHSQLNLTA